MTNELSELITATGKKSRGGLKSYEEMRKDNVQRVRGEFLAATFKPKITFSIDSITFNMSCVNLFPDSQYVTISIDEKDMRFFIEPCQAHDRNSFKFANLKDGKNNPRKSMTRPFCAMTYDFMKWNKAAKYKMMAIYQEFGNKKIITFNLDEALQVFSEVIELDSGKKKRSTIINLPEGWKGRFGYTLDELEKKSKIDITITLIPIENKIGHPNKIFAKLPTPEELIHQPYGGMRPRQRESNNESK